MDNNNNNKTILYNDKLFFKIWRNKILLNKITNFLKIINHNNVCGLEFKNLKDFIKYQDKYNLISIVIGGEFENDQIIELFSNLPTSIEKVYIKNKSKNYNVLSVVSIDLRYLWLHSNLKSLSIKNFNFETVDKTELDFQEEYKLYQTVFKYLEKFKLPNSFKEIKLLNAFQSLTSLDTGDDFNIELKEGSLPSQLVYLRIGGRYSFEIGLNVLPSNLKEFILDCDYSNYSSIVLPTQLIKFLSLKRIKLSILDDLPSSIEELTIRGSMNIVIESLRNKLPSSIKKLKIVEYSTSKYFLLEQLPEEKQSKKKEKSKLQSPSFFSKLISKSPKKQIEPIPVIDSSSLISTDIPQSLTELDLSLAGNYTEISIKTLPKTLVKLSINSEARVLDSEIKFPESLTNLECYADTLMPILKKQGGSNNIKELSIYFYRHGEFDISCLIKLKSLKVYRYNSETEIHFSSVQSFPANLLNVEFFNVFTEDHSQQLYKPRIGHYYDSQNKTTYFPFEKYVNKVFLRSYREKDLTSTSLMKLAFYNKSSPWSNTILLLDLDYSNSTNTNLPYIMENHLPQFLKILILRGRNTPKLSPTLINSLKYLESIYLTHNNCSILKNNNQIKYYSSLIKLFDQNQDINKEKFDSKIYNNLKNYLKNNDSNLISGFLDPNLSKRLTCKGAFNNPYFQDIRNR